MSNNENKILVSFLREYDLWNKTGFRNIGKDIKTPTYDYYNQITQSANGEYIKNIEENFKNNTQKILPISVASDPSFGTYDEAFRVMLSRLYLVDDEFVYDFRNSISKLYSYGLGYNEPEKTIGFMHEADPEKVQIVSPTPLIVRYEDSDIIKDIKLVSTPYGAYKLNLNPNNPIKALSPTKDYLKNHIDSLNGIGDTSNRFYFTVTKKLGSVDKKDTDTKTDKYFLTRLEKIYLSYVTEDEEGFLIKDADTDTIIKRLKWNGEILPDEVLDIQELTYINNDIASGTIIESQIYVITVKKDDENLNIREIKVLPNTLFDIERKLKDLRIRYEEKTLEDVIESTKTNNMVGRFTHEQPFCNMGDGAIINLSEEKDSIITNIGITYDFNMCNLKIKEYFSKFNYIRINSVIYKINLFDISTYGSLNTLFNLANGNENEKEILLMKFTPSVNSVYLTTIENFKDNGEFNFNIFITNTEKLKLTLIEENKDMYEFLEINNKILDLKINLDMNTLDKTKRYFGSCDSVAIFENTNYSLLADGTFESNITPIKSNIPGSKFYNDNVFNTVVIDF